MGGAFGWGILAASSLVVGAVLALAVRIPARAIGLIMGFGAGVLISAVAFDLVDEAANTSSPNTIAFVLTFAAGAVLTMLADTMMPEEYEHGGKLVGVVTTLGFALAFM